MLKQIHMIFVLVLAFVSGANHAFADYLVVVNKKVTIAALSKDEVARIFMIKSKTLPNGNEVVPLSQSSRVDFNEVFFDKITGQTHMQREAYWARLMFTGKGLPPVDVKTDHKMLQMIASDPKYIGFIDDSSLNDTVKVVYRVH